MFLCDEGYIKDNEFTQLCENGINLGVEIYEYQDIVNEIYQLSKDVWKDVWETGAQSAVLGGVITGIASSARVMNKRDVKQVTKCMNLKKQQPSGK